METSTFLERLYTDLKALGLVANQYDFSELCGRTPAWFSTLKARRLPMTTDAALTLSHNIRERASQIVDVGQYQTAMALSDALITQAQQRIARKLTVKGELVE